MNHWKTTAGIAAVALLVSACSPGSTSSPVPGPRVHVRTEAAVPTSECEFPHAATDGPVVLGDVLVTAADVVYRGDDSELLTEPFPEVNFTPDATVTWTTPGAPVTAAELLTDEVLADELEQVGHPAAAVNRRQPSETMQVDWAEQGVFVVYRQVQEMTVPVVVDCDGQAWTGAWSTYTDNRVSTNSCDARDLPDEVAQVCAAFEATVLRSDDDADDLISR